MYSIKAKFHHWSLILITLASPSWSSEYKDYIRSLEALLEPAPRSAVASIASGFGASGGQAFFATSYSNRDLQTNLEGDDDGSLVFGIGLGNPVNGYGGEISIGITSVSTSWWGDGKFGDEGNVNVKLHKLIQPKFGDFASISIGMSNAIGWGGTREMDVNTYVSYSEKAQIGDFKDYELTTTIGLGSAVARGEASSAPYGGISLGRSHYSSSISFIGGEAHLSGTWYVPFLSGISVTYTRAGLLTSEMPYRSIVTFGYSLAIGGF